VIEPRGRRRFGSGFGESVIEPRGQRRFGSGFDERDSEIKVFNLWSSM